MRNDTSGQVGAGFDDAHTMQKAMIDIAQSATGRKAEIAWSQHLRFLTPLQQQSPLLDHEASSDNTWTVEENLEDPCSCNDFAGQVFTRSDRRLRLTRQDDTPDCVHYVAVSYCCASTARTQYSGEPFSIVEEGNPDRPPACPSSLLDRAINFASFKRMQFIWIDQECIEQHNLEDKALGIQSMDLLYQQAEYCLAILEAEINEPRHVDALEMLLENDDDLQNCANLENLCEALAIILADPWFTRAWCLQESTSGNRNMTLLIQGSPALAVPRSMESAFDGSSCIELDLPVLHTVMTSLSYRLDDTTGPTALALIERAQGLIDQWYENMTPDISTEFNVNERPACNAAQALSYLHNRHNSVVVDRLAVMANLCKYDVRLDLFALSRTSYGFSVCALVLSVINGDMSLVVGWQDAAQTGLVGRKARMLATHYTKEMTTDQVPFSWSIPLVASLSRVSYFDHDANPYRISLQSSSLSNGLQVRGCLWIADYTLNLTHIKEEYLRKWPAVSIAQGAAADPDVLKWPRDSRTKEARAHFLLVLLCFLKQHHFTGLFRLLWNNYRIRPTALQREVSEEVRRYEVAAFEDIIDVRTKSIIWPNPNPTFRSEARKDPFQNLNQIAFQYIVDATFERGQILLSRPCKAPASPESYAAVFDVLEPESLTLSPSFTEGLRQPRGYGWYPSNWLIDEGERNASSAGSKTPGLSTCGLVSGLWQGKDMFTKTFILL